MLQSDLIGLGGPGRRGNQRLDTFNIKPSLTLEFWDVSNVLNEFWDFVNYGTVNSKAKESGLQKPNAPEKSMLETKWNIERAAPKSRVDSFYLRFARRPRAAIAGVLWVIKRRTLFMLPKQATRTPFLILSSCLSPNPRMPAVCLLAWVWPVFVPQRTSMITVRNYAQFRGLWVSAVRFDAFWFNYSHITHRYRIVQISQFALPVFPCISWIQPRSKKIQAHRRLWPPTCQSHLGFSRSDPVQTPTQTEIQTKINT